MIKIALLDDHPLVREGLKQLLSNSGIKVVYTSDDGYNFLKRLPTLNIDVAVLDIQMPIMDGFEISRRIRKINADLPILFLSFLNPKNVIPIILEIGVNGFICKNEEPEQLKKAIEEVFYNKFYFDDSLKKMIKNPSFWNSIDHHTWPVIPKTILTSREIEIIKMMAQEMSSKQIGDQLCISLRTVEMHRRRIMEKTESKNSIGAILFALKHNIIEL
ncbi:response regulator transcription factor [Flavobacterium sp.]|uniref:response regulator transcription factor n=1 Tax=Flavobacterium sp. TaxID=239 RepID=UPI0025B93473|nr:response regulator transcription factor [Flavobacterium sp.]